MKIINSSCIGHSLDTLKAGTVFQWDGDFWLITDDNPDLNSVYAVNLEDGHIKVFLFEILVRVVNAEVHIN